MNENWITKIIEKSREIEIFDYERGLANALIERSLALSNEKNLDLGKLLAASFDLLIAAEYYKNLTHSDWLYCPEEDPLLLFVYTNTCSRCLLNGQFHFHPARKPQSGIIGQATSRLLCVFLQIIFEKKNYTIKVFKGTEPVDVVFLDEINSIVFLAEIKASPLLTLSLACRSERLTAVSEEETIAFDHLTLTHSKLLCNEFFILLPQKKNDKWEYDLVSIGEKNEKEINWSYYGIQKAINQNDFFENYFDFWTEAFETYEKRETKNLVFWLTNGCGQPTPRPLNWPSRRVGGGYESVSDGKTSVGLDRTDDIKKGIYQVLKMGAECKPYSSQFEIKVGLISNIHAARHHEEYLSSIEDVVWALDPENRTDENKMFRLNQMYNLFDGIVTFTKSHIRDAWIKENFNFTHLSR